MHKKVISAMIIILLFNMVMVIEGIAEEIPYNEYLSREDSCRILIEFAEGMRDLKYQAAPEFADCNSEFVMKAKSLGIVKGREDSDFHPKDKIKIQDFLIMLRRTIDIAAPDIIYDNLKITDYGSGFAEYAKTDADFLTMLGIRSFYPHNAITKSEADYYISLAKQSIENSPKAKPGVLPQKKVPVLLYHQIGDCHNEEYRYLFVTCDVFEQEMKYLWENGYTFLFPEEMWYADMVQKPIVITFDDGASNNYENAYPILEKYRVKATLFVQTDNINTAWHCTEEQLAEMSQKGIMRIYSHTKTHPNLTQKCYEEIETEYKESNDRLYKITKRDVNCLSYPHGLYNDTALSVARRYYKTAFAVRHGDNRDTHQILRTSIEGPLLDINGFAKCIKSLE